MVLCRHAQLSMLPSHWIQTPQNFLLLFFATPGVPIPHTHKLPSYMKANTKHTIATCIDTLTANRTHVKLNEWIAHYLEIEKLWEPRVLKGTLPLKWTTSGKTPKCTIEIRVVLKFRFRRVNFEWKWNFSDMLLGWHACAGAMLGCCTERSVVEDILEF